jgi:hypothetical protein
MVFCNNVFNFPALCDPAVTIDNLRNGRVMVALSMLYMPFDEIDLSVPYASPPLPTYFADLNKQIDMVEEDIQNNHAETVMVAHNPDERAITAQKVALIRAIEGGFQLGDTDDEIRTNVIKLAGSGVAYITVAHLFFRQVATDVPAVPFLADAVYDFICP